MVMSPPRLTTAFTSVKRGMRISAAVSQPRASCCLPAGLASWKSSRVIHADVAGAGMPVALCQNSRIIARWSLFDLSRAFNFGVSLSKRNVLVGGSLALY
jgi:hypothetical protein